MLGMFFGRSHYRPWRSLLLASVLLATLIGGLSSANSANISYWGLSEPDTFCPDRAPGTAHITLVFDGEIGEGDAYALEQEIQRVESVEGALKFSVCTLLLDSPGGDVR